MDILEFIAAIVVGIAWPAAVVVLFFIFRRSLSKLLPGLTHLKWKDLELEFKRELSELTAAAQTAKLPLPQEVRPQPSSSRTLDAEIKAVAEVSPRAAIPLAWAAVEMELMEAVMRLAVSPDYPPENSSIQNIRHLQHAGAIDVDTVGILERMHRLRNRIVHGDLEGTPVSYDDALEYSGLAQNIITTLRGLKR